MDTALSECSKVQKVLVMKRTGAEVVIKYLHTAQCSLHCVLCNDLSTDLSTHCAVLCISVTLYTLLSSLLSITCSHNPYSVQFYLHYCILHTAHITLSFAHPIIVRYAFFSGHFLCTLNSAICALHSEH